MNASNPRFILGLKLKKRRQTLGLSLKETAQRAAMSISYLSEIEHGKKYPKPERLLVLAEVLEFPYDELVSLRVEDDLVPLQDVLGSTLTRDFPLDHFGIDPEALFSLVTDAPDRVAALVRTVRDVVRAHDVRIESFLFAALRSWQATSGNHVPELESLAAQHRRARGWSAQTIPDESELRRILVTEHGYRVDAERLGADPVLGDFRSVTDLDGSQPTLYVNGRLLPSQRAFLMARELGFQALGIQERAATSSWIEATTFDHVLNGHRASYYAGALLLDRDWMIAEARALLGADRWRPEQLLALVARTAVTPETLLHRWCQLLPSALGLGELYFLRVHHRVGSGVFDIAKVLNLSSVDVPFGIGGAEHYCRRIAGIRLLRRLERERSADKANAEPVDARYVVAGAQRVISQHASGKPGARFLEIAMARPLALRPGLHSGLTLGLRIDGDAAKRIAFASDPALEEDVVGVTCERCRLDGAACRDRAAEPRIAARADRRDAQRAALAAMLGRAEAGDAAS